MTDDDNPRLVMTIREEMELPEGTSEVAALDAAREANRTELERVEGDESRSIEFEYIPGDQ